MIGFIQVTLGLCLLALLCLLGFEIYWKATGKL